MNRRLSRSGRTRYRAGYYIITASHSVGLRHRYGLFWVPASVSDLHVGAFSSSVVCNFSLELSIFAYCHVVCFRLSDRHSVYIAIVCYSYTTLDVIVSVICVRFPTCALMSLVCSSAVYLMYYVVEAIDVFFFLSMMLFKVFCYIEKYVMLLGVHDAVFQLHVYKRLLMRGCCLS